jgi:hypothetical protein
MVHQITFICERATITLESKNGNHISSTRKKKEIKIKTHGLHRRAHRLANNTSHNKSDNGRETMPTVVLDE